MPVITLTTDFGTDSPYVAAMKGTILSINPDATLVDITHAIPPQDVRRGSIVLEGVAERFPAGTIHVAVVDPGVGTDRAIIYVEIGRHRYVAPNNGLLSRLAARTAPSKIIRLENREYWLPEVSSTFHGRDIMAPVAAHLSLGVPPERLGPPVLGLIEIEWPEVRQSLKRLEGVVQEIDSFGNLITNVTAEMIGNRLTDDRASVVCSVYETRGIYHTYAEQPEGTLIALIGSTGRLELAVVGENAAEVLGVGVGFPVVVAWE